MGRPVNEAGREAQRRAILDVAGRLFAEHGFHQTGVAAICDALGMSPGALYRHFRSKAELIEGIVALERANAISLLDPVEASERLDQGLVELLLTCAQAASDTHALALSLEVAAEGARNARVGKLVEDAYRAFTNRLADLVHGAQARGEVQADVDPMAVATTLAATADGLASSPHGVALPTEALRSTLEAAVRGVLAPSSSSRTF